MLTPSDETEPSSPSHSLHNVKSLKFDRRDQKDTLAIPNLFYCVDCAALCGVADLILDGEHKDHRYIYAVEQAKLVRNELSKQMSKTRVCLPSYREHVKEVTATIDSLNESHDRNVQSIHKQFDKIIERVNERRTALLNEVEESRNKKLNVFQELESRMLANIDKVSKAFTSLSELTRDVDNQNVPCPSPVMKHQLDSSIGNQDSTSIDSPTAAPSTPSAVDDSNQTGISNLNIAVNDAARSLFATTYSHRGSAVELEAESELNSSMDTHIHKRKVFRPRSTPPQATPMMLNYIRKFPQIMQSVIAIQSAPCALPTVDNISVVFSCHLEVELLRYGRAVVQSSFRTPSRSRFGPIKLTPHNSGGIINFLGTAGGTKGYSPPTQGGLLTLRCSTAFEVGSIEVLTSQSSRPDCLLSNNPEGSSIIYSLDHQKKVVVTHFSIQHGAADASHALRSFNLEGIDAEKQTFTLIHSVTDCTKIGQQPYGTTVFDVSPPCHVAFNVLRIIMTGPNNNEHKEESWKMCLGNIELFGNLFDS
eukprot:TRINITY_DN27510_c0_g1_i1.p1 TRINITY_DN27510_c0_g1~~TRINITY_DN27510_c0_g1_i1.p1  ORF type:complete len:534 (+),score=82.70 TRINITY_DN27510_c0_g1_i1:96-1697(+)